MPGHTNTYSILHLTPHTSHLSFHLSPATLKTALSAMSSLNIARVSALQLMVVSQRDLASWLLRRRRGELSRLAVLSLLHWTGCDSSHHTQHCLLPVSQTNRNKTSRESVLSSKRGETFRYNRGNNPPSRHVPIPTRLNSSLR